MKNVTIPKIESKDYTRDAAELRQKFIEEKTGATLDHLANYSFDPALVEGNIENFTGIVQMPVGFAGPLLVNGEHAQGNFYVPMATTEGTLVASYSRGMQLTAAAGGISTTIVDDAMQRAPVFLFKDARKAKAFGVWVAENFTNIKDAAESTTDFGKLTQIEQYPVSCMIHFRFCYTTGDAAGQNMCGKATFAACKWIEENYPGPIVRHFLTGNMDTDKKTSNVNILNTRGKKVIAEITLPKELLKSRMRTSPESMFLLHNSAQLGVLMAGTGQNGYHAANGVASIFIATGQDEANVVESHIALIHAEITEAGDYYFSVTLPSLIVATHGGGTGLATQKECLTSLGCYGSDKVNKFAEIVAAAVLCGELSLAAAVASEEWVSSHERLGRNR